MDITVNGLSVISKIIIVNGAFLILGRRGNMVSIIILIIRSYLRILR